MARQFTSDVSCLCAALSRRVETRVAIYYEQSYPFAVAFFAALHAGKEVWVPGNNKSSSAQRLLDQHCMLLGEWGKLSIDKPPASEQAELKALDPECAKLVIFTSGSSGYAKAIEKYLWQLQREIECLEQLWGDLLQGCEIVGIVSHQHIYGLLFRLLWPLAAGRCFHSTRFLSPEPLLQATDKTACWIASPAQLKRLDNLTHWSAIRQLRAIFSSGGQLPECSARQIFQQGQQQILEVYGSSETGGIGWRQQLLNPLWTLFSGLTLHPLNNQKVKLNSPFLPGQTFLDDNITLVDNNCFLLHGRADRIVKVEEKRVSLNELEKSLQQLLWIDKALTHLLVGRRDIVAAVIELNAMGDKFLAEQGRAALIKMIRAAMMNGFETVVLPRKWLFVNRIPETAQGKPDTGLLLALFKQAGNAFPQLQYCRLEPESVKLQAKILPQLKYFEGHFPQFPILPGVAQLYWVQHYGKLFFNINLPFLRLEAVKFKKIIQPAQLITISLEWKADSGKLCFDFTSKNEAHSCGRIVYGDRA